MVAALAIATTMMITTCIPVFAAPANTQTANTPAATARAAQIPAETVSSIPLYNQRSMAGRGKHNLALLLLFHVLSGGPCKLSN